MDNVEINSDKQQKCVGKCPFFKYSRSKKKNEWVLAHFTHPPAPTPLHWFPNVYSISSESSSNVTLHKPILVIFNEMLKVMHMSDYGPNIMTLYAPASTLGYVLGKKLKNF